MHSRSLSEQLAKAEMALASARAGDPTLEATVELGRLAAARREARAVGLLLAAIDLAESLGREVTARRAVLELGRCLVRNGDVVLGRGNLERALGEAQRAQDPLVQDHVADAALGLVEAWLAEGDTDRAKATLSLVPRETPQLSLATALVALAVGRPEAAAPLLERAGAASASLRDPISALVLAKQAGDLLASARSPEPKELLQQLSAKSLRGVLEVVLTLCSAGHEKVWAVAADAVRRIQGASAVELVAGQTLVQSPARQEVRAERELVEGGVAVRLQGGRPSSSGEPDVLTRLLLGIAERLAAPTSEASSRVLHMLDRLIESDLEGAQFFDLATKLALEATGAARGRLIRLRGGEASLLEHEETFVSRSLLRHVVLTGRPLMLEDASEAPPLSAGESVGVKGLRSVVAAPLFGRQGRVLAVLYLDDPGSVGRFGPAEAEVVAGFAARLGPHLENDLRAQLRESGVEEVGSALVPAKLLHMACNSDTALLISGESGVGKEHFARAVHASSARREAPFVVLACGAIANDLLESELFGHEEGAFTGAHRRREGAFQRANGGVLFLDGLQDGSPRLQAELLRAVESGEVRPVGGRSERISVRVLASFQGDPLQAVKEGRLRQDLYYRLSVLRVELPPLRDRRDEIQALTRSLLVRLGAPDVEVTPKAMARLEAHAWPGNLRELQASLERALLVAEDRRLQPSHFRFEAQARHSGEPLRLNTRQLDVLSSLSPGQVLQTGDHASRCNVSPATAWRDLTGLVKAGLLEAEGKGRGAAYRLARPN